MTYGLRECPSEAPGKGPSLPLTYTHIHISVFFLQIWVLHYRGFHKSLLLDGLSLERGFMKALYMWQSVQRGFH